MKSRPWPLALHSTQLHGPALCPSLSTPPPLCGQQLCALVPKLALALGGEGLGVGSQAGEDAWLFLEALRHPWFFPRAGPSADGCRTLASQQGFARTFYGIPPPERLSRPLELGGLGGNTPSPEGSLVSA